VAIRKYVIGRARDIAEGERVTAKIDGRSIVVFRQNGRFYGLLNRCPHRGAELARGRFMANLTSGMVGEYVFNGEDRLLVCPWHGWEFDITTGQSYLDPVGVRTRRFEVAVESGEQVKLEIESGEAGCTPAEYARRVTERPGSDLGGLQPGPYRAETFEVTVEDDYVVVGLRPARPVRSASERKGAGNGDSAH
jgi:nitrite reductase/ring-hydroxylating ferredoxin subunit